MKVETTFTGYISKNGVQFIVYDITAITYKSARHRLKKICKRLFNDTGDIFTIHQMFRDGDALPEVIVVERKKTSA